MNRHSFRKARPAAPLPRNIYRRPQTGPGELSAGRSGHRFAIPQDLACGQKAECGACAYVNSDYKAGLETKYQAGIKVLQQARLLDNARVLPAVPSPKTLEYRSLFKLAVRPCATVPATTGEVAPRFAIGLFAEGSHQVVDMDQCPLHTLPLKRLLEDLRSELDSSPLTPFDEHRGTGQLRYIAARAAHLTGELMLTFVVTEAVKLDLRRLVANLQRRGHKINSAHMNLHSGSGNAIFGADTQRISGAAKLRERLCDLDFDIGPTSFFQINPWQAIQLYRRIEQIAGTATRPGQVAWDLYCGTGQISLILARLGYRVLGIEENPGAVQDAADNARKNHLETLSQFLAARVEDADPLIPPWAKLPQLIVVNPSRRGLAESAQRHLARLLSSLPEARFIYVSCEVTTMARDLQALTELSGFKLRQVEPFDMFPQTDHVEWLAVLSQP